MSTLPSALIFGASGSLGSECVNELSKSFDVIFGHRELNFSHITNQLSAVVWAQGVNQTKSFLDATDEDWEEIFDANFNFVRRSAIKLLKGKIISEVSSFVIIGSVWGNLAKTDKSAYIASKAAVEGLCRALAVELAPIGVRVNCVLPGVVDNEMTRSNLTPEQLSSVKRQTPGGKLVTPLDVARIVSFLCSPYSGGITGESIIVDKGWSIARSI